MATVNVGCKLANGIILEMGDKKVTLAGANSSLIIGGHGITENVDQAFFEAWIMQNKDLQFVKAGHLFAHEKASNTAAQAKDRANEKTGLEPLNPSAMPANIAKA